MIYRNLLRKQRACTVIQAGYRAKKARLQLEHLRLNHDAAVSLQTLWRGYASRCKYKRVLDAARTLQRYARGSATRRQIQSLELAALTVQRAWWTFVQRWRLRWAATTIQCIWRGSIARTELVRKILAEEQCDNHAAVVIQSAWRGFAAQVEFQMTLLDIITVQSLVRRRIALDTSETMVRALDTLQRASRCWLAKQRLNVKVRNVEAATTCQCAFRSWRAVRKLQTLRLQYAAAEIIQRQWRRFTADFKYGTFRLTVIFIQAFLRGSLVRGQVETWNYSATRIQCVWRKHSWNTLTNAAAIAIQTTWRACSASTKLRVSLAAASSIQKVWRGFIARAGIKKGDFAATVIQSCWRTYVARTDYVLDVLEIIFVQGTVRRYLAKRAADKRRVAIQRIQNAWRCFLSKNELQQRKLVELYHIECHKAAEILQVSKCPMELLRTYEITELTMECVRPHHGDG